MNILEILIKDFQDPLTSLNNNVLKLPSTIQNNNGTILMDEENKISFETKAKTINSSFDSHSNYSNKFYVIGSKRPILAASSKFSNDTHSVGSESYFSGERDLYDGKRLYQNIICNMKQVEKSPIVKEMTQLYFNHINVSDTINIRPKSILFDQPELPRYSLLNLAIKCGHSDVVKILIEYGCDPMELDCTGITPLGRGLLKQLGSVYYYHTELVEKKVDIIKKKKKAINKVKILQIKKIFMSDIQNALLIRSDDHQVK